jgi:hypothetical protein
MRAWIETVQTMITLCSPLVALFASAWIETMLQAGLGCALFVALRVSAWIETCPHNR